MKTMSFHSYHEHLSCQSCHFYHECFSWKIMKSLNLWIHLLMIHLWISWFHYQVVFWTPKNNNGIRTLFIKSFKKNFNPLFGLIKIIQSRWCQDRGLLIGLFNATTFQTLKITKKTKKSHKIWEYYEEILRILGSRVDLS